MIFHGISKDFLLTDEQQFDTIGQFWDEIYTGGRLQYEIETFYEDGTCEIYYYRVNEETICIR